MTSPGGNSDHHSNDRQSGDYVFTDLAHLQRIIDKWGVVHDGIRKNKLLIEQAIRPKMSPAGDDPSELQAKTYARSLDVALQHNSALDDYAAGYIDRLTASRSRYLATEQSNVDALRRADS